MSPADIEHYAAAIGITLGVIGASWKWLFAEWLRASREVPSMEGLVAQVSAIAAGGRLMTLVDLQWKNTGSYPLYADCKEVTAYFAPMTNAAVTQDLTEADVIRLATKTVVPLAHFGAFVFEPATVSRVQVLASLDEDIAYLLLFYLPLDGDRHRHEKYPISFSRLALIGPAIQQTKFQNL